MRSDMFEVIIERPRAGSCHGCLDKGRRREPLRQQEGPLREPMSRGRGDKCLNENLAPLRRFLQSRVGRPWNAVHREMCALLNPRSAVQQHVLDHVKQMVELNPVLVDGRAYHPTGHSGRLWPVVPSPRWGGFYVCPRTGALRLAKHPARSKRPTPGSPTKP